MIDPELRVRLILWFAQSWPIRVISWWLEKGVPEREGFGKFRARERIVDIGDLEESTRTTDLSDRRFFVQPEIHDGAAPEAHLLEASHAYMKAHAVPLAEVPGLIWWQEEIRMLRMLDAQTRHWEGVARLRKEADERRLTRLMVICVCGMLAAFAVALYARRYLP